MKNEEIGIGFKEIFFVLIFIGFLLIISEFNGTRPENIDVNTTTEIGNSGFIELDPIGKYLEKIIK